METDRRAGCQTQKRSQRHVWKRGMGGELTEGAASLPLKHGTRQDPAGMSPAAPCSAALGLLFTPVRLAGSAWTAGPGA